MGQNDVKQTCVAQVMTKYDRAGQPHTMDGAITTTVFRESRGIRCSNDIGDSVCIESERFPATYEVLAKGMARITQGSDVLSPVCKVRGLVLNVDKNAIALRGANEFYRTMTCKDFWISDGMLHRAIKIRYADRRKSDDAFRVVVEGGYMPYSVQLLRVPGDLVIDSVECQVVGGCIPLKSDIKSDRVGDDQPRYAIQVRDARKYWMRIEVRLVGDVFEIADDRCLMGREFSCEGVANFAPEFRWPFGVPPPQSPPPPRPLAEGTSAMGSPAVAPRTAVFSGSMQYSPRWKANLVKFVREERWQRRDAIACSPDANNDPALTNEQQLRQQLRGALACSARSGRKRDPAISRQAKLKRSRQQRDHIRGICAVCMQNPYDMLLRPCNHVVMCRQCYAKMSPDGRAINCPVCMRGVVQAEALYMG